MKDERALSTINTRLLRITQGNFGDVRPERGGLSEARVTIGKGHRINFMYGRDGVIILLNGTNKSSKRFQNIAMQKAISLARECRQSWS
ncbi:type II toxin-antitoxin system RelE/ParE family toxin [Photobacterium rosenbergii]|uniref:type II toxin-antitoxin system RelE/ParE family toxin n=1 Tax=Photobacterium rosenbergii TaxID=294936 RepID=UPI003AFA7DEC